MAAPLTLDEMIADAQAKLHALNTGRLAVKIVIEGQETEFNRTSVTALEAYLSRLQAQRAGQVVSVGAIGFLF